GPAEAGAAPECVRRVRHAPADGAGSDLPVSVRSGIVLSAPRAVRRVAVGRGVVLKVLKGREGARGAGAKGARGAKRADANGAERASGAGRCQECSAEDSSRTFSTSTSSTLSTCITSTFSTLRTFGTLSTTRISVRVLYLADIRFPLERANGIQSMETC